MFKRFLPILTLLLIGSVASAQVPEPLMGIQSTLQTRSLLAPCLGNASAGKTTRKTGVRALSNNVHFLCLGDTLYVSNQGSNLTEDPKPSTTAGVGYIFYNCPPTISGPRWSDVKADACINKSPFNGSAPTNGLYIARGDVTGRDTFVNNGSLQNGFNNGRPLKQYFAPATIYNFNATLPDAEGDTACVNVNVNIADQTPKDTFSVVYLNSIRVTNQTLGTLSGSFQVVGGLSEYDGSTLYNIVIQKNGNPSVVGTITSGTRKHGNTLTFTVPEEGQYDIIATDGVSCNGTGKAVFPTVQFKVSNEVVNSGSIACVKVTATGFTNIGAFQFDITYDPALLVYDTLKNSTIPGFDENSLNTLIPGNIVVSWFTNGGVTRPDNSVLFEVCFKAIGPNGTISPVKIDGKLTPFEVGDANGNPLGKDTIPGSIKIGSSPVNVKLAADSVLCNGEKSGRIKIIPTGSGAPFSYSWQSKTSQVTSGFGTMVVGDTGKIVNLAAGIYYVTITNATADVKKDSIEVFQPAALFSPTTVTQPCSGQTNGSIRVNASGGTAPYKYLWNTGATTSTITNLATGSYAATITDSKGCRDSIRVSIGAVPITVASKNVTPALCKEVKSGSILISSVTGGSPVNGNYTFKWSNNITNVSTTSNNPNLGAGKYFVTISDNTCESVDSFTVPAQRLLSLLANVTNALCNGASTGTVLVTASGSTNTPYIFTWTGVTTVTNNVATSLAQSLKAGNYPLSIKDQDGCKLDSSFTITQPNVIKIDSVNLKNESCLTGNDGTITIAASGGASGFTYRWSRSVADNQPTISNLIAGTYTVTVTDASNCTQSRSFVITVPIKPIVTVSTKNATCFEKSDGVAKLKVTPPAGATVTDYKWDNGGVIDSIKNLQAGTYKVTITLSNGCLKDTFAVVKAPAPITIDTANSSQANPTCPDDANGTIILVMKGGTAPYRYTWTGGQPTSNAVFASLKAGVYQFTVTDFNGCQPLVTTVPLVAPRDINVAFTDIMATTCFGVCNQNKGNGKATAIASGGSSNTGIYTYIWASGETTAKALELCGGWQKVTVSDGTCFKRDSVDIPQPLPLTYLTPKIEEPTCFGLKDAKAEVLVEGGTPPYAYAWSNGSTTKDIISVGAGSYSVVVSDKNQCVAAPLSIEINQPQQMQLDTIANQSNNVTCYGADDGRIKLIRTGGNGGSTTYNWSPNVSKSDSAFSLKSGIYYITATDKKGCSDSISVQVTQPDKIYYFLEPPVSPHCNSELTFVKLDTAFGSTYLHPFTISVDNGPQYPVGYQVPVFAGEHLITITEQITGCSDTTNITISEPPPIIIKFADIVDSIPTPRILVGLGTEVRLNPIISGSLPIDSVSWTPKDYLTFTSEPLRPLVKPLDDRTYKLRVTDVNGCVGLAEIAVELERNRNIFIPNVFSPNDDDKNDYFGVFSGVGVKAINFIRIYDRWGELLFQNQNLSPTSDPSQGWDGTFRGKLVQQGVYVYLVEVEFEDGIKLLYRGDVTVAR